MIHRNTSLYGGHNRSEFSVFFSISRNCLPLTDHLYDHIFLNSFVGELKHLYGLSPIAVIGGSFLPGLAGHNISEAAAAGCAVLTGEYLF